jgi:hypothetical protein
MERRADERGMLVLTGHSYDLTVTPPYGPWAQIARGSTHRRTTTGTGHTT